MRLTVFALFFALNSFVTVDGVAEHRPLLPRPQKIQYGSGQLPVRGLKIRLVSPPAGEDLFAAQELSRILSQRGGEPVLVEKETGPGAATGSTITLERTGAVDALPLPGEEPGPRSRESYRLKVTPSGAEIQAPSSAGLFYAVQTLGQLAEGAGERSALPAVDIQDWPGLAYRGTMVDMSHGPLPREAEVDRQLDFLARWKANQYYFYNEASIELDGYPLLNPGGRFTREQVGRIIAYGRARHIDVIPCLELYGHLHDLFRVERYSDLATIPNGGEFNPANPRVLALLTDWINQFASLFPSPFVHVGFDETWEIETAAKHQGTGTGPAKLYIRQLENVDQLFERHGKRVMAWADIMVKYPEIVSELPPGLMAVAWHYDPQPEEYRHRLDPLVAKHVPTFIATGVTSWNQVAPDFDRTFANIDTFLEAGRRAKTLGLINTIWTDDAETLMRMSWPGMAYGASAAWQSAPIDRAAFFADYAQATYPTGAAAEVAAALDSLAQAETSLQKVLGEDTMLELWASPFTSANLERAKSHREDLRTTRLLAEQAQQHLYRALSAGGDSTTLFSLLFGARLLDYAGMKNLYATETADLWQQLGAHPTQDELWRNLESELYYQSHGRIPDLMDAISELRESYRSAWLAEYTPYRLPSALGRWDAEYEYWRRLQARFYTFSKGYHQGQTLPSLESVTKPD